jgi:hypothetical protein
LATTFDRAFKGGALEQLQGQVDSLVIMLGQIVDPTVYWVFTGEDFDLNISNPENPSVLVIGNNPDRFQSYGVLLSLLNGKLTKTINKKGQLPLGIIVDECPTLPFESVSTLIATARSNKVACILGIQDLAQFVLLYGQEKANMIVNMVGSILTGQIRGSWLKLFLNVLVKSIKLTSKKVYLHKVLPHTVSLTNRLKLFLFLPFLTSTKEKWRDYLWRF